MTKHSEAPTAEIPAPVATQTKAPMRAGDEKTPTGDPAIVPAGDPQPGTDQTPEGKPEVITDANRTPAKTAAAVPPGAAKGDDDVMSEPPAKTGVVVDIKSADGRSADRKSADNTGTAIKGKEMKGKWKHQVAAAKLEWTKLTDAELLKTDGNEHKLATLVQERQVMARSEAYKQVKAFFEKQKSVAV